MKQETTIINNNEELTSALKRIHNQQYNFHFKNHQFNIDINAREHKSIHLENCIFTKEFKMSGSVAFDFIAKNVCFKDKCDFKNVTFDSRALFLNTSFDNTTDFTNTVFKSIADFSNSKFHQQALFLKTEFLKRAIFSKAMFNKNTLFTDTQFHEKLILQGTQFQSGLDLSLSNPIGSINLFGIKINNYQSVPDLIDNKYYDESINDSKYITHKSKRETFRILKKELQNQGNAIDALQMAALEKSTYSEELKSDRKLKIGKWSRRAQNRFILTLGEISNSHGESWTKGVGFTLSIGLFFFYLSLINTRKYYFSLYPSDFDFNSFEVAFNYYWQFLLPTHKPNYMDELAPEHLFSLWDFVGRIFVSFGIYQTVVAFRKFHSK